MFRSLVILCSVIILFHGVNSYLHPKFLTKGIQTLKTYKRQANTEVEQCIIDRLSESSECDLSMANPFASIFCLPDCGQFALDIARDCGADPDILAALCDSNENGQFCYDLLRSFDDLTNRAEVTCFTSDICPSACQSELSQGVAELGCCLSVFVDYVISTEDFNPQDLFDECNVDLPEGCNDEPPEGRNNSPLSSTSFQATFFSLLSALALRA